VRAGKVSSLLLAGFLGAVSAVVAVVVTHLPVLHDKLHIPNALVECVKLYGVFTLLFFAVMFPLGASIDRSLARLHGVPGDQDHAGGSAPRSRIARWINPLLRAFDAAIECYRRDQARLRDELQSVENSRRAIETTRRHSEAVLHTLRDVVIVTDDQDRVVMLNGAAAQLFDLDAEAASGRPVADVIPQPRLCRLIHRTRQAGGHRAVCQDEIVVSRPAESGGGKAPAEATFEACLMCVEHGGRPGGVVAVLHDLTRERELLSLKTDFISKASHELRTPLSSIRAYIEMLIDGEARDDAARQQFYAIVHEEADRLARLIDNLLNVSRIEAGIVNVHRERLAVKSVILDAVHALTPTARERGIALINAAAGGADLEVDADRDMLHEVMVNLISNALRFTPAGGSVTIDAARDAARGEAVITVADTGPGIPVEAQQRVFEKFFRLDRGEARAAGTGLGLTVCKHIVESLHEGRIGVDSAPGAGARFWFSLPDRSQPARSAA